jgi:hypothetical protein
VLNEEKKKLRRYMLQDAGKKGEWASCPLQVVLRMANSLSRMVMQGDGKKFQMLYAEF